jgi:hypothetical protein
MEHAWLIDTATGKGIEITWADPGVSYFGIVCKTEVLGDCRKQNGGSYSLLFNWMGEHCRQLIEGLVPASAILA